jgi:phage repressor protein C with HTH and peptisase S24 domain
LEEIDKGIPRKIAFLVDTNDEKAFAFPIMDDSMYPEFMLGEVAAVSPQEPVRQGDFALVNLSGKIMLRQVLFTPREDIIILKVLNSQHNDNVVDKKETQLVILGRIISKQKRY